MTSKFYRSSHKRRFARATGLALFILLMGCLVPEVIAQSVSNTTYTVNDGNGFGTGEYIRNLKYSNGPAWGLAFYTGVPTGGSLKRMTIRGGNVGIGTDDPAKLLDVFGTNASIRITDGTLVNPGTAYETKVINHAWDLNAGSSFSVSRWPDNAPAISILESNLNTGFGITSPAARIDAAGTVRARNGTTTNFIEIGHGGTNGWINRSVGELQFRNAGTTQMTLTGNGMLGVNVLSPASAVDANGVVRSRYYVTNTATPSNNYAEIGGDESDAYLNGSTSLLDIRVQGTTRMVLNAEGNVGIGTIAPAYKLDVKGPVNATELLVGGKTLESVVESWMDSDFDGLDSGFVKRETSVDGEAFVFRSKQARWREVARNGDYNGASNFLLQREFDRLGDYYPVLNATANETVSNLGIIVPKGFDENTNSVAAVYLGTSHHQIEASPTVGMSIKDTKKVRFDIDGTNAMEIDENDVSINVPSLMMEGTSVIPPHLILRTTDPSTENVDNIVDIKLAPLSTINVRGNLAIGEGSMEHNLNVNGMAKVKSLEVDDLTFLKGKVGIGTSAPTSLLHIKATTSVFDKLLRLEHAAGSLNTEYTISSLMTTSSDAALIIGRADVEGTTGDDKGLAIGYSNGHVGIGSLPNAESMLFVNGTITAADFKVNGQSIVGTGTSSDWIKTSDNKLYYNGGNIGIGTSNPASAVDVVGDLQGHKFAFTHHDQSGTLRGNGEWIQNRRFSETTNDESKFGLSFFTSSTERMTIDIAGHVGIGTHNPTSALDVVGDVKVAGKIFSSGGYVYISGTDQNNNASGTPIVKSTLLASPTNKGYSLFVEEGVLSEDFAMAPITNWADYVFENGYKLKNLDEVESFIKDNKHLPNVPSQAHIAGNGYSMHDMNVIMMEKIEELTLYVIEQEKKINTQNKKIEVLEAKLVVQGKN